MCSIWPQSQSKLKGTAYNGHLDRWSSELLVHREEGKKFCENKFLETTQCLSQNDFPCGSSSFILAIQMKVKPGEIVDKAIEIFLDLVVPGRGASDGKWWLSPLRQIEEGADRANRELDIRSNLRRWDHDYPEIHHELLVRWIAGFAVSFCVTSIYNGLKPQRPKDRRY